jgi:hypothetical protein
MSVLQSRPADHPNAVEARALRRAEIEHAMRALYRDAKWIGDVAAYEWLCRIHYLDPRKGVQRQWLRNARIDGATPVDELSAGQRDRLCWQMLLFLRGQR